LVKSSNISSEITTLLVSATFLIISLACSTLSLDNNHLIDSGRNLVRGKMSDYDPFFIESNCVALGNLLCSFNKKCVYPKCFKIIHIKYIFIWDKYQDFNTPTLI
jgi:hypothetical protein